MSRKQTRSLAAAAALSQLALLAQAAPRLANRAPTASISAPGNGATFASGSIITIAATASDADGSIARVDFYVDGVNLGRDSTAPYSIAWSNAASGTHALKVVATDNRKATGTSATVSVSIAAKTDTIAPSIPGGLASTAQSDASISLRWNASSDNVGGSGVAG
jgi:chitinase